MIRLPVAEREFALALIASAAVHAALLPLLLSPLSGSATVHIQPIEGICITAFLVPETRTPAGKAATFPVRKTRPMERIAAMAAAPLRETPEKVAPVENDGVRMLADVRPSEEWLGKARDVAEAASSPPMSSAFIPETVDSSGTMGSGTPVSRQGIGESLLGNDAEIALSRPEGTDTPQHGSGVRPPMYTDADPRYGDNILPDYPPLARLRGYQGVAVLSVEVLADGRVGQVGISRSTGHEILDRTALEAVRLWKFEPGRRNGRPVSMSVTVPVRFVLKGKTTLVKMHDGR